MKVNKKIEEILQKAIALHSDEIEEIRKLAQEVIDMSIMGGTQEYLTQAHNLLGNTYWGEGRYDLAKEHYQIQMNYAHELGHNLEYYKAVNNIALIDFYYGDFETALRGFLQALSFFSEQNDEANNQRLSILYSNIGLLYSKLESHTKSLEYFHKAEELNAGLDRVVVLEMMDIFGLMGHAYKELGDYAHALEYYKKSYDLHKESENVSKMSNSYCLMGDIFTFIKKYDEAEENFKKAIAIQEENKIKSNLYVALKSYGRFLVERERYEEAQEQLEYSLSLMDELHVKQSIHEVYLLLAKTNVALKKHEDANDYYQKYTSCRDVLFAEHKSRLLLEIDAKYSQVRQKSRVKHLEEEKEQLQYKNSELEIFAGRAAHDIKEPLRNIHIYSTMLKTNYRDKLDEKGQMMLDFVSTSSLRLSALLTDLLDYARIGRNQLELISVDLTEICLIVQENLAQNIKDSNAEVKVLNKLPIVRATNSLVVLLLQNIISNSIRYRKDEVAPVIEIKKESSKSYEIISIRDNGRGIDESEIDKIFDLFYRSSSVMREKVKGSGIGLSSCKKIMEAFYGKIEVASAKGEGTTFKLYFPKI